MNTRIIPVRIVSFGLWWVFCRAWLHGAYREMYIYIAIRTKSLFATYTFTHINAACSQMGCLRIKCLVRPVVSPKSLTHIAKCSAKTQTHTYTHTHNTPNFKHPSLLLLLVMCIYLPICTVVDAAVDRHWRGEPMPYWEYCIVRVGLRASAASKSLSARHIAIILCRLVVVEGRVFSSVLLGISNKSLVIFCLYSKKLLARKDKI